MIVRTNKIIYRLQAGIPLCFVKSKYQDYKKQGWSQEFQDINSADEMRIYQTDKRKCNEDRLNRNSSQRYREIQATLARQHI